MADPWTLIPSSILDEEKFNTEMDEWKHARRQRISDSWAEMQRKNAAERYRQAMASMQAGQEPWTPESVEQLQQQMQPQQEQPLSIEEYQAKQQRELAQQYENLPAESRALMEGTAPAIEAIQKIPIIGGLMQKPAGLTAYEAEQKALQPPTDDERARREMAEKQAQKYRNLLTGEVELPKQEPGLNKAVQQGAQSALAKYGEALGAASEVGLAHRGLGEIAQPRSYDDLVQNYQRRLINKGVTEGAGPADLAPWVIDPLNLVGVGGKGGKLSELAAKGLAKRGVAAEISKLEKLKIAAGKTGEKYIVDEAAARIAELNARPITEEIAALRKAGKTAELAEKLNAQNAAANSWIASNYDKIVQAVKANPEGAKLLPDIGPKLLGTEPWAKPQEMVGLARALGLETKEISGYLQAFKKAPELLSTQKALIIARSLGLSERELSDQLERLPQGADIQAERQLEKLPQGADIAGLSRQQVDRFVPPHEISQPAADLRVPYEPAGLPIEKSDILRVGDDPRRIHHTAGEFLPLDTEDATTFLRNVYPDITPDEITTELSRVGWGTPEGIKSYQNAKIAQFVEEPARPLVRKLLDEGKRPVSSNAYGPGPKGVKWVEKDALPDTAPQFTPLKKLPPGEGIVKKITSQLGGERGELGWRMPNVPMQAGWADKKYLAKTELSGYVYTPARKSGDKWLFPAGWNNPKISRDYYGYRARKKLSDGSIEVWTNNGWKSISETDRGMILYQGAHRTGETPIVSKVGAYGPGTYLHSEPGGSGSEGYAEARAQAKTDPSQKVTAEEAIHAIKELRKIAPDAEIKTWELKDKVRMDAEASVINALRDTGMVVDNSQMDLTPEVKDILNSVFPTRIAQGQNIRPIYIPEDMRFLDDSTSISKSELERIKQGTGLTDDLLPPGPVPLPAGVKSYGYWSQSGVRYIGKPVTGTDIWTVVRKFSLDTEHEKPLYHRMPADQLRSPEVQARAIYNAESQAQRLLSEAGYDGIKFGGNNYVIFPDSLHKVRNAITGTEGGFGGVEAAITHGVGSLAGAGLGAGVAYDPSATKEENIQRMAIGGTLGAAALGPASIRVAQKLAKRGGKLAKPSLKSEVGALGEVPNIPEDMAARAEATKTRVGAKKTEADIIPIEPVDSYTLLKKALTPVKPTMREFAGEVSGAIARAMLDRNYNLGPLESRLRKQGVDIPTHKLAQIVGGAVATGEDRIRRYVLPVIKPVSKDIKYLEQYMVNMRNSDILVKHPGAKLAEGLQRHSVPKIKAALLEEIGQDRYDRIVKATEGYKDAAGNKVPGLWEINRRLILQPLVDEGILNKDQLLAITTSYEHYIDFHRGGFSFTDRLSDTLSRPEANVSFVPIHKMEPEGSLRTFDKPLIRTEAQIIRTATLVARNRAAKGLVKALDELHKITGENLAEVVKPKPGKPLIPSEGMGFVSFYKDGEQVIVQVPEIYSVIAKSLEAEPLNVASKLALVASAPLRGGAVTYNPAYLPVNIMRDSVSALYREGLVPFSPSWWKGLKAAATKNELFTEAAEAGVLMSGMLENYQSISPLSKDWWKGAELEAMGRAARVGELRVENLYDAIAFVPRLIKAANKVAEESTRIATYSKLRGQGVDNLEAAIRARDVTVDFAKSGNFIRLFNQLFPFTNAGIQGASNTLRLIKDNPKQFAIASTVLGIPTIAAILQNEKFDSANTIPQREFIHNWIFIIGEGKRNPNPKTPSAEGETFPIYIKIPKGSLGALITAPWEIGLRAMLGTGDYRMLGDIIDAGKETASAFSPIELGLSGGVPAAASPILGLSLNRDPYTTREIVPMGEEMQGVEELQYGPDTSKAAIALGQLARLSPKKLDWAIQDFTAGVGQLSLWASDLVLGALGYNPDIPGIAKLRPQTEQEKLLGNVVVKRFVGSRNTAIVNKEWEELDRVHEQVNREFMQNKEIKRFGIGIGQVSDTLDGIPLTPAERAKLQAAQFEEIKLATDYLFKQRWYDKIPTDEQKQRAIRDYMEKGREAANKEFYSTLGTVEERTARRKTTQPVEVR